MAKRKNQPPFSLQGLNVDDVLRAAMKTPVEPKPLNKAKKRGKKK